jgi:hypothetical protein
MTSRMVGLVGLPPLFSSNVRKCQRERLTKYKSGAQRAIETHQTHHRASCPLGSHCLASQDGTGGCRARPPGVPQARGERRSLRACGRTANGHGATDNLSGAFLRQAGHRQPWGPPEIARVLPGIVASHGQFVIPVYRTRSYKKRLLVYASLGVRSRPGRPGRRLQ